MSWSSSTPPGADTARRKESLILLSLNLESLLTSCDSLAPKYEELGQLYAGNPDLADKVTIAKIDATANDIPEPIQGFPTIKIFPAGAKDSPIEYAGDRTVEDLADFIKENGKYKADALAAATEKPQEGGDVTNAPSEATVIPDEPVEHDEL